MTGKMRNKEIKKENNNVSQGRIRVAYVRDDPRWEVDGNVGFHYNNKLQDPPNR